MCSGTAARTDIAAPSRDALLSADAGQVKKDAAAMVLQRLLRGRAMQTRMYEGLQTKIALIRVRLVPIRLHTTSRLSTLLDRSEDVDGLVRLCQHWYLYQHWHLVIGIWLSLGICFSIGISRNCHVAR